MRKSTLISLAVCASLLPHNAIRAADQIVTVETGVYEWTDEPRFAQTSLLETSSGRPILATFGPFIVVDTDRVELLGSIETDTTAQFAAMLRAFPAIVQIDMIDCPGTGDDEANFAIARMIRKAGITTNVPDGGSVRSGGVELFLAGAKRRAAPNAEFAVHSWRDSDGKEADDFTDEDPVNLAYIGFYTEMGLERSKANAFYALTNSVSHDDALYLQVADLQRYAAIN